MPVISQWVAAVLCVLVGLAAVMLRRRGSVSWIFLAGMVLLALERVCEARALATGSGEEWTRWIERSLWVRSVLPGVWLGFSLVYARGNRGEFYRRWKWVLMAALLVPPMLASGALLPFREVIEEPPKIRFLSGGRIWIVCLLAITLGILLNLEKTFRASVGMTRWRLKYLFLGTSLIFGVKLYSLSQMLLYGSYQPSMIGVNGVAVIIGCGLIAIGHSRASFSDLDLYPSRALLQGSLTVLLAGGYFLVVGVLAQVVGSLGGAGSFQAQAFLILVGVVVLTVLLLSDRFRSWLQRFVSRHFRRPEHDFRKLWSDFTRRTANELDAGRLGGNAAEVISEHFHVLGVSVLLRSPDTDGLEWLHTTAKGAHSERPLELAPEGIRDLERRGGPLDLEEEQATWGEKLREACGRQFPHGGRRLVVPLTGSDRLVGLLVLSDRVNGVPYSHEELDLLRCIGDQLAAGLLNCSLTEEVLRAKELEAFQTLSTFFVHDLKNAANSLNLMLQNLPVHFDDPEFREDAIRAVGRSVERIDKMILNLSSLRQDMQLKRQPCALDELVREVLDEVRPSFGPGEQLDCRIEAGLPRLALDGGAMRSVMTNLVNNAREAIDGGGRVTVRLEREPGAVRIEVADDGCGMSEEFVRTRLFRPFHSTKTKGLGIGMFQCMKIVEAHQGRIRVESEPGRGTTFRLRMPLKEADEARMT